MELIVSIRYTLGFLVVLVFALSSSRVDAQSADKKDASATSGCTDVDFWAGDWEVRRQDKKIIATVSIKLSKGHCFATEYWHYTKLRGSSRSVGLMAYSNQQHNWEYLGGANYGFRWRFSNGEMIGNELRFSADDMSDSVTQTFSFFNLPDGRIHELEVESSDGGKTWKTNVDIYWSRRK
jgi:hypothetical protein